MLRTQHKPNEITKQKQITLVLLTHPQLPFFLLQEEFTRGHILVHIPVQRNFQNGPCLRR